MTKTNIRKADKAVLEAHKYLQGALETSEEGRSSAAARARGYATQLREAKEDINVLNATGISTSGKKVARVIMKIPISKSYIEDIIAAGIDVTGDLNDAGEALDANAAYIGSLLEEMTDAENVAQETMADLTKENKKVVHSYLDTLKKWSASIDWLAGFANAPSVIDEMVNQTLKFENLPSKGSRFEKVATLIDAYVQLKDKLEKVRVESDTYKGSIKQVQEMIDLTLTNSRKQLYESGALSDRLPEIEPELLIEELKDIPAIVGMLARNYIQSRTQSHKEQKDFKTRLAHAKRVVAAKRWQVENFEGCIEVLGKEYGFTFNPEKSFESQVADLIEKVHYSSLAHEMEYARSRALESRVASAEKVGEQYTTALAKARAENKHLHAAGVENIGKANLQHHIDIGNNEREQKEIARNELVKAVRKIDALEVVLDDAAMNEAALIELRKKEAPQSTVAEAPQNGNVKGLFSYFSADARQKRAAARNQKIFDKYV